MRSRLIALAAAIAASLPIVAATPHPAAAQPTYGANKWAVIVGITNYRRPTHHTFGGTGDANTMYDVLVHNGWAPDHILLLEDSNATLANVRGAIQWLQANADDSSFSVFSFSGHVKQTTRDRDHDGERIDEWLWPYDNRLMSDRELSNSLSLVRTIP